MIYQLDTRDYRCPLPLLMIKDALKLLKKEDVLSLFISTESDVKEIEQLCERLNCRCSFNPDGSLSLQKLTE